MSKGPVLFDLDETPEDAPKPQVAEAPPVPDLADAPPTGQAMQTVAAIAARKPSRLARWFWGLLVALIGAVVSLAAWDFVTGLIARSPILGWAMTALIAALLLVLLIIALREVAAFGRLGKIDQLRHQAAEAQAANDLEAARAVSAKIIGLYKGREDTRWGRDRLKERQGEQFEASDVLGLLDREVLVPLDAQAMREVEAAARQVATVTALVPLALADVVAALTSNLRMIRRIAEVYGGRSGVLGGWRLTRAVLGHLVATGAVAVGDDMIGSFAGGGVLSKLSRRFGEGIINGALTARVGVAAMEVCRPLPFEDGQRPSVSKLVGRALAGMIPGR